MISHSSGYSENKSQVREGATAVVLAGLIGSVVDWVVVLSQFTQRGDVSPILPPLSLLTLILGIVVSIPAIALTNRARARPVAAAGVAIVGSILVSIAAFWVGASLGSADILFTLVWLAPIIIVAIPSTTWLASRTGHAWRLSALAILALVTVATILVMWFGLPRV